ncbi:lysozyme inhibitor LprI family protein [Xenophilus sp. Marseille-Q4582]|uniref:lysozyme inhibitor LprI family protein n=1 Tax=Xenophilus sp. Marseille-Q4582 TaxID=2866600 RepID=UPI001CE40DC6|nr:lysozyme inhibitor LprI family protein [Xenophilus sp. Marseille-Q4582]
MTLSSLMRLRAASAGFGLLALSAAHADTACLDKAQTQAQMNACAAADLKQADDRLNQVYQQVQGRLQGDAAARQQLLDAQRKWLAFRDAECAFQTMRSSGGSLHALDLRSCLAAVTQARVQALRAHLDCAHQAGEQEAASCAVPREP